MKIKRAVSPVILHHIKNEQDEHTAFFEVFSM